MSADVHVKYSSSVDTDPTGTGSEGSLPTPRLAANKKSFVGSSLGEKKVCLEPAALRRCTRYCRLVYGASQLYKVKVSKYKRTNYMASTLHSFAMRGHADTLTTSSQSSTYLLACKVVPWKPSLCLIGISIVCMSGLCQILVPIVLRRARSSES